MQAPFLKTRSHLILTLMAVSGIHTGCQFQTEKSDSLFTSKEKPNIIFIATDDLKPMLGSYGDEQIKTPHLDRLAENAMVFQKNYCQVPVCGASRASLLTGKYADNIKVWTFDSIRTNNPDIVTLPQYFRQNGYQTINLGKIFDYRTVDKFSDSLSWDEVFPVEEEDYYPHYNQETGIAYLYHYQHPDTKEKYRQYREEALRLGQDTFRYAFKRIKPAVEMMDVPDDAYKDGIFGKLAVDKIHQLADQAEPFFLGVGFHKPHLPFVAPKRYWDLYNREDIELAEFREIAENDIRYSYHNSNELRGYTDENGDYIYAEITPENPLAESEQKKLIHAYMATVSYVDAQVGKIMDALEENDLMNNTIIVFWGDHGWHLGDHGMWGKVSTFEQATFSPLLIAAPKWQRADVNLVTEFVDIYPTLCEMANLPVPENLDGESLLNIRNGNWANNYAISQWPTDGKMGYAIRDNRYRYVEWVDEGLNTNPDADLKQVNAVQLFDYETDPKETKNLAGEEEYSDIEQMMREKLYGFYRRNGLMD